MKKLFIAAFMFVSSFGTNVMAGFINNGNLW